ncbi:hypothetical protein [Moellerella wisconsensis]|uniref:hypothetical protein n=1 Tax=Moellerella wisconsensis TaxID=158849 RepID=UPI0030767BF7
MQKSLFIIPALLIALSVSTAIQATEKSTESDQIQALKSLASGDKNGEQLKPLWERGVDGLNAKKCDIKESLHELSKKMENQFSGESLDVETTAHAQAKNDSPDKESYACQ